MLNFSQVNQINCIVKTKYSEFYSITIQILHGTKKSGSDKLYYVFDEEILAFAVLFVMIEYSDPLEKCAGVEVRGCDIGKNSSGSKVQLEVDLLQVCLCLCLKENKYY